MKKLNKTEQEKFHNILNVLLEETPCGYLETLESLEQLVTINHSLNKLNELACGCELTINQEKRLEKLECRALGIIKKLGFKGDTQRDPRGDAILIYLPSKKFNSWDGESYRIGIY